MKFPQNALRSKLTNADNAKTAAAKMLQSDTLADMTETCFVIDASSASIKAPDSIKFNVTSSRPINGDVILVLEASDGDRWFKLPKTDDDNNKYELTVNFSNEVTGIMNAFCFAHDGKIYVSDKTRLVVTPDLSGLRNVKFADDSGILLVSAGEEKSFTLLAETEDGEIYVISSPQMGTSYSIDDSSVVKVTAEGRLLGLKEGETTLTAANGGFSAKVTVIVDPGTAQSTDPVDPINPVDPADPGSSGSGGGGCSALGIGFGVMALAAGILLKKRGKR
ncbi:hypothetical protein FACS1894187_13900 [Synergistales bacterium]|nr:hypothetical protein FACS1894187_13900 [Synergistales bacterium]